MQLLDTKNTKMDRNSLNDSKTMIIFVGNCLMHLIEDYHYIFSRYLLETKKNIREFKVKFFF